MPLQHYDEQSELTDIELRYTNTQKSIPYTLQRLQQSPVFLETVKQLRIDGWKDWHILQAIFNGVMSWYASQSGANQDEKRLRKEGNILFRRLLHEGEAPDDPVIPPTYFTLDAMEAWLNAGVLTFLKQKGAVFRPRAYNPENMRKIVKKRYHYFELDTPHSSVFSLGNVNNLH
jgi:hypothetical protein